jgi:hypothetical protein
MTKNNVKTNNTQANSILAQVLCDHAINFKNRVINPETLGNAIAAREWQTALDGLLATAYKVVEYNHNNINNPDAPEFDMGALYACAKDIVTRIGEVNGMKLSQKSIADTAMAFCAKVSSIDITPEMAHARAVYKEAAKVAREDDATEDEIAHAEELRDEMRELEKKPGNCKSIITRNQNAAFRKAMELSLGNAIACQNARSSEDIEAELKAKAEERKAKAKARKAAARAKAKEEAEKAKAEKTA